MKRKRLSKVIGFVFTLIIAIGALFLVDGFNKSISLAASGNQSQIYVGAGSSFIIDGASIGNVGENVIYSEGSLNIMSGAINGDVINKGEIFSISHSATVNGNIFSYTRLDLMGGIVNGDIYSTSKINYDFSFSGNLSEVSGKITLDGKQSSILFKGAQPENLNVHLTNKALGDKVFELYNVDLDLSKLNVTGLPANTRLVQEGEALIIRPDTQTLRFASNNSAYGIVKSGGSAISSLTVKYGSVVSISGNTLTVDGHTLTATPSAQTAQYSYAFSGWSVANGTVINKDTTITANFTQTLRSYNITYTVNSSSYGKISLTSQSVPYGSVVTVSGSTLTAAGQTNSATPTAQTAQYTYAFSGWFIGSTKISSSVTITGDTVITANFTRTTRTYTVTLTRNNTGYGTLSSYSISSVPYGATVSVSSNTITINGTRITATAASATSQYSYAFSSWSVSNGTTITGNKSITATFTRSLKNYTVTISTNNSSYGSVSQSSVSVPYGTTMSASGATLTLTYPSAAGGNKITITATPAKNTSTSSGSVVYAFANWSNLGTVNSARTITANFTRSEYVTVDLILHGMGSMDSSYVQVEKGTTFSAYVDDAYNCHIVFTRPNGETITVNGSSANEILGWGYSEIDNPSSYLSGTINGNTIIYAITSM